MTASPLTWPGFGTEALSPSLVADSRLHPAGSDFPAASELRHTPRHIPVHASHRAHIQGLPTSFPSQLRHPGPGMSSCPDKAQGRLPEEGSQLLPAPGWVEADVSNPRSSEGPKTNDITPSSCPSSPQNPYHGEAALGRARRKREGKGEEAGEKEGRQRLELEVGYFGKKTKFCKTSPARLQKRWKNWRLSSGRSCYQGEPYLSMGLMALASRAAVAANPCLSFPRSLRSQTVTQQRRSIQERGLHGGIATVFAACRATGARTGHPSMEPSSPSLPQFMVGRSEGIIPCSQSSQR